MGRIDELKARARGIGKPVEPEKPDLSRPSRRHGYALDGDDADLAELTPKQARFVREYLLDENATQAAIRAGYNPRTAKSTGHENLTKPEIAAAIRVRQSRLAADANITQEMIVREYVKIAFADDYTQPIKASDKNKALAQLAKLLGMDEQRLPGKFRIHIVYDGDEDQEDYRVIR